MMPYLNGGLFAKTSLDELGFNVPDMVFEWLFEPDTANDKKKGFLEIFNFAIDESQPLDVEVAVDPEMLGKVYESLIAEEERGNIGIFYTPRVEIDLMYRISLVEFLANETKIHKEKIIDFIFDPHNGFSNLTQDELKEIKSKIDGLKIAHPAVGSASFLVGMMNILVELHSVLKRKIEYKKETLFALKQPILPNLTFKIRQGNSLVEEIGGIPLSLRGETLKFLPKIIEAKINELINRKNAFFSSQINADLREIKEIEKLEHNIFTEILDSKSKEISRKIEDLENTIHQLK